ncbi:MAG: hypothetical protein H3C64_12585 [Candidatus Kuenenia stuttgartiensis]|uniref:Uncharacterized protein n=1 Tax=Kuenenia stuttgartiensis TaxID=174633 RepID=A0A2C9CH84_KUEST|nr:MULTISPECIES: hypothetical protein [Kuenenia]MBW7943191.1 hypothetical protein [Candidatus Kuenenia stuttgartiensis]MBZ0192999.1 hypothetical protein [Candidatus Kuenenia stuttgartiensis]MCL4727111.1 hypothetical protein [Candidatus Kuenenia stuttgartiensis]MCZ7622965.1 hypothetical protein [Candidatus Kuenenia sp.]SOH04913.1 hypothetical protein KSMBR1_2426 [Candidatus Kuenenia stuttgartiensis]
MTIKPKLKILIITVMALIITLISLYSFVSVSRSIDQIRGADLFWNCFAIWIKGIILTQGVLVVGGLFLFMLRKPKGTG